MSASHLRLLPTLFAGLLLLAGSAAAQGWEVRKHLGTLAEEEIMATGLHELTELERTNLEKLIAYEVASARAGNVTGFAGTFSSRRSADELKATGLDRLSEEQRTRLDEHIAGFIATTPSVTYVRRGDRADAGNADSALDDAPRGPLLDVHGEVSLTVGGSRDGSYYGGSLSTTVSDPKGRFSATVTIDTTRGNVPYYYDPYYRERTRYPYLGPVRGP